MVLWIKNKRKIYPTVAERSGPRKREKIHDPAMKRDKLEGLNLHARVCE
jgi:hypothetical protein